jgi:hypothetical protein
VRNQSTGFQIRQAALGAIDDCGFMGRVFRNDFCRQNGLCALRCVRKAAKLLRSEMTGNPSAMGSLAVGVS